MGDAVSGIDAARHRDGAAHELSLKGSGKALDGRQKVIHIRQRCRNLAAGDFPGLFIGESICIDLMRLAKIQIVEIFFVSF